MHGNRQFINDSNPFHIHRTNVTPFLPDTYVKFSSHTFSSFDPLANHYVRHTEYCGNLQCRCEFFNVFFFPSAFQDFFGIKNWYVNINVLRVVCESFTNVSSVNLLVIDWNIEIWIYERKKKVSPFSQSASTLHEQLYRRIHQCIRVRYNGTSEYGGRHGSSH